MSQVSSVIHRFEEMVDFSSTFPSEIAVISSGNHGNFLRKSRQLLEEITATSEGNHGDFCRQFRFLRQLLASGTDGTDGTEVFGNPSRTARTRYA